MKILIKKVIASILRIWSVLYTYTLSSKLVEYRNLLYTMWIRNFLGSLGENSTINYPCSLQGGGLKRIKIGDRTSIQAHCTLGSWVRYGNNHYEPEIFIGNDCNIGQFCHITAINRITIGDGLLTGRFVYIGDNTHGCLSLEEANTPPVLRHLKSKGEIIIGNNVWIGDKVSVFGGVTIGDNVIVGAGSIVTHDIPSNSMAAGAPAKIFKQL